MNPQSQPSGGQGRPVVPGGAPSSTPAFTSGGSTMSSQAPRTMGASGAAAAFAAGAGAGRRSDGRMSVPAPRDAAAAPTRAGDGAPWRRATAPDVPVSGQGAQVARGGVPVTAPVVPVSSGVNLGRNVSTTPSSASPRAGNADQRRGPVSQTPTSRADAPLAGGGVATPRESRVGSPPAMRPSVNPQGRPNTGSEPSSSSQRPVADSGSPRFRATAAPSGTTGNTRPATGSTRAPERPAAPAPTTAPAQAPVARSAPAPDTGSARPQAPAQAPRTPSRATSPDRRQAQAPRTPAQTGGMSGRVVSTGAQPIIGSRPGTDGPQGATEVGSDRPSADEGERLTRRAYRQQARRNRSGDTSVTPRKKPGLFRSGRSARGTDSGSSE